MLWQNTRNICCWVLLWEMCRWVVKEYYSSILFIDGSHTSMFHTHFHFFFFLKNLIFLSIAGLKGSKDGPNFLDSCISGLTLRVFWDFVAWSGLIGRQKRHKWNNHRVSDWEKLIILAQFALKVLQHYNLEFVLRIF